ncbi:MAG: DUF2336 domain-containing protein [Rhodobiaceae bacterium]|nr:DUF2336 domain-containing protein [Rhodobiaceae bacterium]MCC0048516.1 DUF2336 domain-containing protein [Rhodobiaceae bacterium]
MMPESNTASTTPGPQRAKTGNARADTLLGLTGEFVANRSGEARPEIRHYPAIALAMLPYVDLETRMRVAGMLAGCAQIPHNLAFALADDAIEVAAPILERTDVLSEGDMIRIINANTAPHAMSIARRKTLPVTVIDALLARGNADLNQLLERNHGEAMQREHAELSERRPTNSQPAPEADNAPGKTHAGPPQMATALPDRTLAKLFWTGDRDARAAVMTVVSRKAPAAIATVPQQFGVLAGAVGNGLVQLANSGRAEDLIAGLARISGMSRSETAKILADDTGEPLAVALAALQIDSEAARNLIGAVVPKAQRVADKLIEDISMLGEGTAGRLLQAMCGRPADEKARRLPLSSQVMHGTRPGHTSARRNSNATPMRRHSDIAASPRAS